MTYKELYPCECDKKYARFRCVNRVRARSFGPHHMRPNAHAHVETVRCTACIQLTSDNCNVRPVEPTMQPAATVLESLSLYKSTSVKMSNERTAPWPEWSVLEAVQARVGVDSPFSPCANNNTHTRECSCEHAARRLNTTSIFSFERSFDVCVAVL